MTFSCLGYLCQYAAYSTLEKAAAAARALPPSAVTSAREAHLLLESSVRLTRLFLAVQGFP